VEQYKCSAHDKGLRLGPWSEKRVYSEQTALSIDQGSAFGQFGQKSSARTKWCRLGFRSDKPQILVGQAWKIDV